MMTRVAFPEGKQSVWINQILEKTNLSVSEVAKICKVSARTFRDWRRGKYTIPQKALLQLSEYSQIPAPSDISYLSDFWYVSKGARNGGLRRLELYGSPGTIEGRRRGGRISQQRRKENPEKYRVLGCIVRKVYKIDKPTTGFAELVGILLGDGGITNSQVRVTISSLTDKPYAKFISQLMYKVLGEYPSVSERPGDHTINLTISGMGLVELLLRQGLVKGNKINQKIDFPNWIFKNVEFEKACVRGLIDTDGGLYFHNHWTKGIKYRNLGLCFTTYSYYLLKSVAKSLDKFNLKYSLEKKRRLYIYDLKQIEKYFTIIGSNNPKHKQKLSYHLKHSRVLDRFSSGGVG